MKIRVKLTAKDIVKAMGGLTFDGFLESSPEPTDEDYSIVEIDSSNWRLASTQCAGRISFSSRLAESPEDKIAGITAYTDKDGISNMFSHAPFFCWTKQFNDELNVVFIPFCSWQIPKMVGEHKMNIFPRS